MIPVKWTQTKAFAILSYVGMAFLSVSVTALIIMGNYYLISSASDRDCVCEEQELLP